MDKGNSAYILKHNSSTLMWIASTVAVPLSSIAFTFHRIMGKEATHLTWNLIAGLIIVFVGLILYPTSILWTKTYFIRYRSGREQKSIQAVDVMVEE